MRIFKFYYFMTISKIMRILWGYCLVSTNILAQTAPLYPLVRTATSKKDRITFSDIVRDKSDERWVSELYAYDPCWTNCNKYENMKFQSQRFKRHKFQDSSFKHSQTLVHESWQPTRGKNFKKWRTAKIYRNQNTPGDTKKLGWYKDILTTFVHIGYRLKM